jgi:hypothetical protein
MRQAEVLTMAQEVPATTTVAGDGATVAMAGDGPDKDDGNDDGNDEDGRRQCRR